MSLFFFFFFNDTATTEIYTLSLHDALPILLSCLNANQLFCTRTLYAMSCDGLFFRRATHVNAGGTPTVSRSEEHTSELQSRLHLVCRLLLEKKKRRRNKVLGAKVKNTAHVL